MNKTVIIYIVIIIIIVLGGLYFWNAQNTQQPNPVNQNQQTNNQIPAGQTSTTQTTTTVTTTVIPPVNASTPVKAAVKTYEVSIVNFSFNPATLTINQGDSVIWTNNDSVPHQIISDNFKGPVMSRGQTFTYLSNNTTGTINYHCNIHPSMTGVIIVK